MYRMGMLKIDHLVFATESLTEGLYFFEERLQVSFDEGGAHDQFGTHNKLLSLGDCYFELIAIDPQAPSPERAIWYDLKTFSGSPRIITWVCETDRMSHHLTQAPYYAGEILPLSRGALKWDLTVPDDGSLPMNGCAPSLINWKGAASPAKRLPDRGCRLSSLTVYHPDPEKLGHFIYSKLKDPRIIFERSQKASLRVVIETPKGLIEF